MRSVFTGRGRPVDILGPMKKLICLLLGFTAFAALAAEISFSAKEGWIRAAPPGARALAGYAVLGNESKQLLRIVDASSSAFEAVVFHESYEAEGIARMRARSTLEIPAEGSLTLSPGGLHLMLLRPTRPISEGASIIVDLINDEGDPLPIVLRVRKGGQAEIDGNDHDHHQHH